MTNKNSKFKIAIIDYNISNLFSIDNAFNSLNYKTKITNSKKEIISSDLIVLPGVGAFNKAISNLKKMKIFDLLKNQYLNKKPILSICLGMQILFDESEEFVKSNGLAVIKGKVCSFKKLSPKSIIPHVGWNSLNINKINNSINEFPKLVSEIENSKFYFVHSYYVDPKNINDTLTYTKYDGINFCSSILKKNLFACQFHPEKSGNKGLKLIDTFIKSIK